MRNWLLKMVAMTEYGRKRTDGSSVVDNAALEAVKRDAGIPHLPTQKTYEFRLAVSGEGPLAYQWSDKPHRLLYDACSIIESEAAQRQTTQSDALLDAEGVKLYWYRQGKDDGSDAERAKIVAWLRGMGLRNINYIADAIEVGEHLK